MGKIFFIADTHFGDSEIIKYEKRPFDSVDAMTEELIKNWNSVVTSEDIVFVVGDFISVTANIKPNEIVDRLNGSIKLIKGNHDNGYEQFYDSCNITIIEYPIVLENFWIISHEPMFVNNNMPYANIFGHIHSNPMYKDVSSRSYCVCVERINYTPVTFDYIKEMVRKEVITDERIM